MGGGQHNVKQIVQHTNEPTHPQEASSFKHPLVINNLLLFQGAAMGIPGAVGAGAAIDTDSSIRMGATGPKLTAEVIIILRIIKFTLCQHAHRYTAIPL